MEFYFLLDIFDILIFLDQFDRLFHRVTLKISFVDETNVHKCRFTLKSISYCHPVFSDDSLSQAFKKT